MPNLKIIFLLIGSIAMAYNSVLASVIAHADSAEQSPIEHFLSAVSILFHKTQHVCSGVILNSRWIITSAHCVNNYTNPADLSVQYGSNSQTESSRISVTVVKIVVHPDFDSVALVNNIALVKVKEIIKFGDDVQPAKLPSNNTEEDEVAFAIGWEATTKKHHSKALNTLKYYRTTVMALDLCWERVENDDDDEDSIRIPDSVICTYGPADKTLPPLDNGSALISVENYELIGIASRYKDNLPKIYTRIHSMFPWIKSILDA